MSEYKKSISERDILVVNSKNPELLKECLELKDQGKLDEMMDLIGDYHKKSPWRRVE